MGKVIGTGVCPVPACGATTSTQQLMCRRHWFSIPSRVRTRVWIALSQYERSAITLVQLRAVQRVAVTMATKKETLK